ncbi:uncharacterized protein ALTATR162_LOCUS117 [Alternaria atra]|uniref:Uncharacterized protein n=1 Tax=Alternaria atra TaxID=119953 RepID=A0A8J2MUC3_9PLEO|nr:uncharacterized protein ALTATR162_LOCUS117 [Alternaria atra]CAG5137463.1 unnamed protein product [Alternaria atra]
MNGFVSSTPMSGYDDFVRTVWDQFDNESPQFMINLWHTMPMDTTFDPMRIDPALMMSMGMDMSGQIAVSKLREATRDKLLAITQSFLHKARAIHEDGSSSSCSCESPGSTASHSNFVLLPPARVLECFLKSYTNSFERYYPTSARGVLDTNELIQNYNDKASSLLTLMMIAHGAMTIPSIEVRWLTGGFTEACRISLFDLIEKNIIMTGEPIVLHAALLFTVPVAWSGDKWQMDIAMGQRGMYLSMLRHSGILGVRPPTTPHINGNTSMNALWKDWLQQESRSR